MKIIYTAIALLFTISSCAQKTIPRFENDTLYTTSGYKIYKGQELHFAKGTDREGSFRYARVKEGSDKQQLTDHVVTVTKLKKFYVSGLGNPYITVKGTVIYKDGSKGFVEFNFAFDRAIESFPGLPSELIVPDEYKKAQ